MAEVALRAALVRLGLTQPAALFAIDDMALNTLNRWRDSQTDTDCVALAKNLRAPGGGHAGFQVSLYVIGNLKIMRLALKHHQNIQRPVVAADITEAWIETWEFLVEWREMTKRKVPDAEDLPKIIFTDWAKTKEMLIAHFSEVYGEGGIPLAAYMRENEAVPAHADDPQADYNEDHDRELIARAPHAGRYFRANNKTLCLMLKKICANTPAYSYISSQTVNGRAAWLALMQNYLGPQHMQLQAAIWEAKLHNTTYSGESSRFTYDKYCDIHQLAHTRLQALEGQGYKGLDEGTKIRHFLNGIKTKTLDVPVETVRTNPVYPTFEAVARRIKDSVVTLKPLKSHVPTRDVSDVHGEEPYANVEADMSVEDKFYPPDAWAKMSAAKKKGVLQKRKKRRSKHAPPKKDGQGAKESKAIKALKQAFNKKIAKVTRKVASLETEAVDDDEQADSESDHSDDEEPPKKIQRTSANRSNPAINRPKKHKSGKKK